MKRMAATRDFNLPTPVQAYPGPRFATCRCLHGAANVLSLLSTFLDVGINVDLKLRDHHQEAQEMAGLPTRTAWLVRFAYLADDRLQRLILATNLSVGLTS